MSVILYGEIEAAKYGMYVIKYDKSIGIIRCWNKYINNVLSILSLMRYIFGKSVNIRIFGYSGTIKGAQKKYMIPNINFTIK